MKKILTMIAIWGVISNVAIAQQDNKLSAEFDKVVNEELQKIETGATILVSSHGKIIYKKALGMANIELNVPMQTDNVFKIASITKQFTAIAILQLMEQGKLNLDDEVTHFLPDYPVEDSKITIEHLLTHTSGIHDYAIMKDTIQRGKIDFTPIQMIRYFQNEPKRFPPGTRYEYSNSNYFLLGYIIEKLTGKTYQQYLDENFFQPLSMANSFFASDAKIIKNRAAGYSKREKGIENAEVMSMTGPYAAGGIMSTVEDLFKWNRALYSYKLVKKQTLEKALTKYKLVNGSEIRYGYGFRFGFIQESPSIWHGGLINGFMSMAMYLPQEDVFVTVLSNCNNVSPERVTAKLAAVAIGRPYSYKEIAVSTSALQIYSGLYKNEAGDKMVISTLDDKLFLQRGNGPKVSVKAFAKDAFFLDDGMISMKFTTDTNGKLSNLVVNTRNGSEVWNKTE